MRKSLSLLMVLLVLLGGCASTPSNTLHPVTVDGQRNPDFYRAETNCRVTTAGKKVEGCFQRSSNKAPSSDRFDLTFLEYGDNGHRSDPQQIEEILATIGQLNEPLYVVVYVHGLQNDAQNIESDDEHDLTGFHQLLAKRAYELRCGVIRTGVAAATKEKEQTQGCIEPTHKVLGVFVGWRGQDGFGPLNIGGRAEVARRIGEMGDFRRDLLRLAMALERRSAGRPPASASRLLVMGHSLGGAILSHAFMRDLRDGITSPLGERAIITTLNPAVSAQAYRYLYEGGWQAVDSGQNTRRLRPGWLNITSQNDSFTRTLFPLVSFFGSNVQVCECSGDIDETIGHYAPFHTHELTMRYRPYDLAPSPWYRFPEGKRDKRFVLEKEYNCKDDLHVALSAKTLAGGISDGRELPPPGIWNIYTDDSVIGKGGGGFSSIFPKHNAFVQQNLGRLLDLLVFDDDLHQPLQ